MSSERRYALLGHTHTGLGSAAWGAITGTLSDQTDLQSALDLKAPLASPTFTGTVDVSAATLTGLSSDDLSDVASIAMLDESETVTGAWTFSGAGVFSTSLNAVPLARSVTASDNTATTDYGIVIRFTSGSSQTFTLDADPPTNAVVLLDNSAGAAWTIAASTSLIWAKDASTGNRTLADDGVAVAIHRGSGTWIINGSALLT